MQCSHIRTHACTHAHTHRHKYTYIQTHKHMHAHTQTHMHAHKHTHTHTQTHKHTHAHTHKHTRTHAHARKHAHTHTHMWLSLIIVVLISPFSVSTGEKVGSWSPCSIQGSVKGSGCTSAPTRAHNTGRGLVDVCGYEHLNTPISCAFPITHKVMLWHIHHIA